MNHAFALDTNVIVAALSAHHAHNEAATSAIARIRQRGDVLIVPAPALLESFSVLTRLPRPHQLTPRVAAELLSLNFESNAHVVALDGPSTWTLLASLPERSISGGSAHDAHIAECARAGGATTLLTFNLGHFERFESPTMKIVDPRAMR